MLLHNIRIYWVSESFKFSCGTMFHCAHSMQQQELQLMLITRQWTEHRQ